ncbi:hypothetical protein HELRODRAFT_167095 [Helobdella robusta]|uniref:Uncharacterized protein n=1 Tax=Helobdella robusta TaxID=6412 RepID=T1EZ07_HELRO|nr:hypothetical protein HELRODRAFT_167095 [Helobdella robusta]ESO10594.1 hypothetical protein HELRODRAFT_167095 [Helobdella robusta]
MSSLVNYESGDESDDDNKMDESNSIGSPTKRCSLDEKQTSQKMEDEWDNFEKMISDKSGSQQQGQNMLDPPSLNTISYPSYKQSTDLTRSNLLFKRSTKEKEEDKNTHKERKSDKIESGKSTCKEDKDSPPVPDSRKRKISDISKDDNSAKDNKNVKNKSENDDECRQRDGKNKMKRRSRSRSHSKKRMFRCRFSPSNEARRLKH